MIKIRLFRIGKKRQPIFKIIVTPKTTGPKSQKFIEILGYYNPLLKKISVKKERVDYWLSCGAKLSDTLHNLFVKNKLINAPKIKIKIKSKKKEEEKKEESEKPEPVKAETKAEVKS